MFFCLFSFLVMIIYLMKVGRLQESSEWKEVSRCPNETMSDIAPFP